MGFYLRPIRSHPWGLGPLFKACKGHIRSILRETLGFRAFRAFRVFRV